MKIDFLQRLMKYCAGMERSTYDILSKLEEWNVPSEEKDEILEQLRSNNFVDDHRYARSYVTEKWNLDRWGKIKIKSALEQKNIGESIIEEAISLIDEMDYIRVLHEVLQKKLKEVRSENHADDARRVLMYAKGRGFEEELILEWLSNQSIFDEMH